MFILDANGLVKNIKEISDKRERVLYYSYHYNAEIENGGHIQLFVNKDDWNFEEMQELFAPIYSADLCENLRKAVVEWKSIAKDRSELTDIERIVTYAENFVFFDMEFEERGYGKEIERILKGDRPKSAKREIISRKAMSDDALRDLYYHYAELHGAAEDYREVNGAYDKLVKIYKLMESDETFKKYILDGALAHIDLKISCWAASDCLCIDYRIDDVLTVLQRIGMTRGLNTLSFEAKMTVSEYAKGRLKRY